MMRRLYRLCIIMVSLSVAWGCTNAPHRVEVTPSDVELVERAIARQLRAMYPDAILGFQDWGGTFSSAGPLAMGRSPESIAVLRAELGGAVLVAGLTPRGCVPPEPCVDVVVRIGQVGITADSARGVAYTYSVRSAAFADLQFLVRRADRGWEFARFLEGREGRYISPPSLPLGEAGSGHQLHDTNEPL